MSYSKSAAVTVQLQVLEERDKAIKVLYLDEKFWLPRSQITKLESVDISKKLYNVTIYEWLWDKKIEEIESGEMVEQRKRYAQDAAIRKRQAQKERQRKSGSKSEGGLSESSLATSPSSQNQ